MAFLNLYPQFPPFPFPFRTVADTLEGIADDVTAGVLIHGDSETTAGAAGKSCCFHNPVES